MSVLDQKKRPGSVDSALDQRMNLMISVMDSKLDEIVKGFNLGMEAKNKADKRVEIQLTHMVQVMWGLLNEQKIRLVTLEDFVINKGVGAADELEQRYLDNIAKFKEESGWEEVPIEQAVGINPLDAAVMTDLDIEKPF